MAFSLEDILGEFVDSAVRPCSRQDGRYGSITAEALWYQRYLRKKAQTVEAVRLWRLRNWERHRTWCREYMRRPEVRAREAKRRQEVKADPVRYEAIRQSKERYRVKCVTARRLSRATKKEAKYRAIAELYHSGKRYRDIVSVLHVSERTICEALKWNKSSYRTV